MPAALAIRPVCFRWPSSFAPWAAWAGDVSRLPAAAVVPGAAAAQEAEALRVLAYARADADAPRGAAAEVGDRVGARPGTSTKDARLGEGDSA